MIHRNLCGFSLLVIMLAAIVLIDCSPQKENKLYTIGMVQITENPVLDEARNSVVKALEEEGFSDGQNIQIVYQNAQGEISNIPLILKNFISAKMDLIITISTPCMVAAAQLVKDIPVVFTVAFSPEQVGLKEVPPNLTGAYDPFEMDRFVEMMRTVVPALHKIGVVCNRAEPNARYGADQLRQACIRQSVEMVEMPVFSSNDVLQAAQALAQKQVGAFAIAADNTVFLSMQAMVKVAEAHKIPVFASDPSQIERGASAGYGIDYREWGRESGKMAAAIIRGEHPHRIPIKAMQHGVLYLNLKAAAAQGVTFPAQIIAAADQIVN